MGEKGNILDTGGLTGIGSGFMSGSEMSGAAGDPTGGHHEGGIGSVMKAAAHHLKTVADGGVEKDVDLGGVEKDGGLGGALPSPLDEKPSASQ